MRFFRSIRGSALVGLLASVAVGCNGSPGTDASLTDTGTPMDASIDGAAPDVTDASDVIGTDGTTSVDTGPTDVASTPDVPMTSDVPSVTDASDVTTLPDLGAPVDVTGPVDVSLPAPDGGVPCVHDSDCTGPRMRCGYWIPSGCAATGVCVTTPTPSGCGVIIREMGCGCDGSAVSWIGGCAPQYPANYAPAPISHMGMCP